VMETMKRVLGAEHPHTLRSMANLAYTLKDQKRKEGAIRLMASCLTHRMDVLGQSHHDTQSARGTLMTWLSLQDEIEDDGLGKALRMPGAWVE